MNHEEAIVKLLVEGGGRTIYQRRQTGKTTMLLKAAHELGADNVVIFIGHQAMRMFIYRRWKELFPGDKLPEIMVFSHDTCDRMRGHSKKALMDEPELCQGRWPGWQRDINLHAAVQSIQMGGNIESLYMVPAKPVHQKP